MDYQFLVRLSLAAAMGSLGQSAVAGAIEGSIIFPGQIVPHIDFTGSALSGEDRELVQRALSGGPNFAGLLTAARAHCGPACSRLVLVVTQYFVWNQDNSALVPSGEYRRTSPMFCVVAAR